MWWRNRPRIALIAVAIIVAIVGFFYYQWQSHRPKTTDEINLRLEWTVQSQFAGYIVADRLGYYAQEGLKVNIRPAGPDLKPLTTVAAGTDDVGIGVSNQVALAQANGAPVKVIAQMFQDSANRYVLLSKNRIGDLAELRGKKVGLWLGGDEAEFIAMLATKGMKLSDVQVVPEGESVVPFLNGDYVLSEVTIYNELNQIEDALGGSQALQIISPSSYNSAIVGDDIVVTEHTINTRRDILVRFLRASMRGWQYAISNPEKTVDLVLAANPELKHDDQLKQLRAINQLILSGISRNEIGEMKLSDFETMLRILRQSGQLNAPIDASTLFDQTLWQDARK